MTSAFLQRRRLLQIASANCILLLFERPGFAQADTLDDASLAALISDFAKLRTLTYNEVRDLKVMHAKAPGKLAKSEQLYFKAKSAADSWIETVRLGLITGGKLDAKLLNSRAETLQTHIDALINFSQTSRTAASPGEKHKNMALITAIAALVVSIGGFAIQVYQTWSSADEKKRSEIRTELELLRWGQFQQI
ncbi:hypothetical protein [Janthinobacterium agaricidamnosum]|uniref:Uncharacterized protein n=1 Tax=Janthinobacterium agaricidamnosum NBRC 102515 = DSM 9628 TaxID=1349767 RepID=W0V413_9BURK|nr:hypothetical protein [Janthinobacterium agaricidamnosum]CDG81992.1 hypothetical protein GJA_1339 [Janthinobacterium agaricidamnosum NBRC 102515 = DSM 9628]